jgi:hypothetical protein
LRGHQEAIDQAGRKFGLLRGRDDHETIDVGRDDMHDHLTVATWSWTRELVAARRAGLDYTIFGAKHAHLDAIANANRRAFADLPFLKHTLACAAVTAE